MSKDPIFVPLIGQYDNIGDVILRRPLLDWLRAVGTVHVYIGGAPSGYEEALAMKEGDFVYRSFVAWIRAALTSAVMRKTHYIFKPGEIQLSIRGMKEHLAMLPLQMLLGIRGGKSVRVGSGTRNFSPVGRALMRPSIAMTDYIAWRDRGTRDFFDIGSTMPDLAFSEGDPPDQPEYVRDALVISMRIDRPEPNREWISAIKAFAISRQLDICVVTQVQRDSERSRKLAMLLGANELHDWRYESHSRQEDCLRNVYRRTSIVISDRLHVLIAAYTHGATPISPLTCASDKIDRHFSAAGIPVKISRDTSKDSEQEIISFMEDVLVSRRQIAAALPGARLAVGEVRHMLYETLGGLSLEERHHEHGPNNATRAGMAPAEPRRAVAWHVGRIGDVAGGMTQVINAYTKWKFRDFDIRVIRSRDGSKGLRAVYLFAIGLLKLVWTPKKGLDVIVVHLSQGGSFVREGLFVILGRCRGCGVIAHIHGSRFVEFSERHRRLVQFILNQCSVVIVLSDATKRAVERLARRQNVVLVPNAVERGRAVSKEKLVVFGGAVSKRKGVDVLIDAWQMIRANTGWKLVIAGPKTDFEMESGLEAVKNVEFLGAVSHADLMKLLDRSEIAVLPSRDEAMPMFILEAMARRNCVISTFVGGIPKLLGGGAGLLVSPGDPKALGHALESVIDNSELRREYAAAGVERFEAEFSADVIYPRLESVWHSAVQQAKEVK